MCVIVVAPGRILYVCFSTVIIVTKSLKYVYTQALVKVNIMVVSIDCTRVILMTVEYHGYVILSPVIKC